MSLAQTQDHLAQTANRDKQLKVASQLYQRGLGQLDTAQFEAAIVSLQQSLKIYRELDDKFIEPYILFHLRQIELIQTESARAFKQYQQSLLQQNIALSPEIKKRALEGIQLGEIGHFYAQEDRYDKAPSYFERSLAIAKEVNNQASEAKQLHALALVKQKANHKVSANQLLQQGDEQFKQLQFDTAAQFWQAAMKIAKEIKNEFLVWQANHQLEQLNLIRDNIAKALQDFEHSAVQKGLVISPQIQSRAKEGIIFGEMGRFYHEEEKDEEIAINYLEKSLAIAREVQNQASEKQQLIILTKSYQTLDDLENNRWIGGTLSHDFDKPSRSVKHSTKAIEYGNQGLTLARALSDRPGEALILETIARSYAALGQHSNAIEAQQQGLTLARESQDKMAEANALKNLGIFYRASGNYGEAIRQSQAASNIYRAYQKQVETAAPSSHPNALPSAHPPAAYINFLYKESLAHLGDAYQAQGDYANAVKSYQAAQTGNIYLDARVFSQIGHTFAQWNKLSEAEAALRLAIKMQDSDQIYEELNDMEENGESDIGLIWVSDWKHQNLQRLQEVLVRQNRTNEALEISEEAKARVLVQLLAFRSQRRNQQTAGSILQPEFPQLSAALKLDEIRKIAKTQNATLVQYSIVGGEQLYIWVIKPTGEVIFRSTQRNPSFPLTELVRESRFDLGIRGRAGIKISQQPVSPTKTDSLAQLYQYLIAPIAQDLPTDPKQRVIFLPQGELFLVPFAALPDAQNRPLIERHTLSTAPSIQTLALTQTLANRPKASGNAVIVGDPTMPTYQGELLQPLPAARQEAIAIGQQLNTTPLIGAQATKATVLQQIPTAKLLHFATHGLLDPIKGNIPGAIALAPDGQDNGFLSAAEIFNLQLNADLVVLSACDTGQGDITGDGVIGLSRSFIAAGAPSVIVSLWAVNDQSTSDLMQEFYRQLKQQPDKAQALRQAMLITKQRYPDPSHWAAFTLVGEAQ
ncbi:CHAT domain-containing protein [Alkalinema sp. FACHB-956]|uniref:CHAT domain-containing protein n=1 Tax=Alkalinema sp. FACHB-956 TaxID=2692768 RepID=UPI00168264A9|nr:CHAT domain-containing protein [Alkalinema sp. FACHB-956]MBD2328718.1 CHAT domain-containing protein [Alkalinema sp. FACHB-956]